MIDWFTIVQIAVAVVAAVTCLVVGLTGHRPNDLTLAVVAAVELMLIAQVVVALVAPATGNAPTGNVVEFWVYLVSAVIIPPAAVAWALTDRERWSTLILAVACFAVAVMVYRMSQIWFAR
jgi:hypothetical protein